MRRRTGVIRQVGSTLVITLPKEFALALVWKVGDHVLITEHVDSLTVVLADEKGGLK